MFLFINLPVQKPKFIPDVSPYGSQSLPVTEARLQWLLLLLLNLTLSLETIYIVMYFIIAIVTPKT